MVQPRGNPTIGSEQYWNKRSHLHVDKELENKGVLRHGELLVQADPDLRDAGQRGTGGTEEKDHDNRPHPLGEKNGCIEMLKHPGGEIFKVRQLIIPHL